MASDEGRSGRKVRLKSSDGEEFLVEETVAMESQVIRRMIVDRCADSVIPLANVNSKILSKVIEYCTKQVESAAYVVAGGDDKASDEGRKLTLRSSEGEEFRVEETVAMESQTIQKMIEDGCVDSVSLTRVNSKILSKVIEYCKKIVQTKKYLEGWESDFLKVNQAMLVDIFLAASSLDIEGLLDLTSQTVEMQRKTVQMDEEMQREIEWALERKIHRKIQREMRHEMLHEMVRKIEQKMQREMMPEMSREMRLEMLWEILRIKEMEREMEKRWRELEVRQREMVVRQREIDGEPPDDMFL